MVLHFWLAYDHPFVDGTVEQRTSQHVRAENEFPGLTLLNHRQQDLIRHALGHSAQQYTIEFHRNSNNVVYETARSDLMDLADRGLLQKRKRGKTWVFTPSSDLAEKLRQIDFPRFS
jgi:Fic family protein